MTNIFITYGKLVMIRQGPSLKKIFKTETPYSEKKVTCRLFYSNYTGLLKIIIGVLTTCHTQYT